jgi:hypothetical protein
LTGVWEQIDHINGDKTDNRACNLRSATKSQNAMNTDARSNNRLQVKGVSVCPTTGRFRADIRCQGKSYNLGRYDTIEAAKAAYNAKAAELFGEYARP